MDIPEIRVGPPLPEDEDDPRPRRSAERLRWRLAAGAMAVLLLEVLWQRVSWGLYVALAVGVAGYFQGDVAANKFGGYALTRSGQAARRRLSMVPALWVFYWGTDFRNGDPWHLAVQSAALVGALILILVPEPGE